MSRLLLLVPLLLLAACSDNRQAGALLDRIDSLTCEQPDSALCLLQQHEAEAASWSRSLKMRHALLTARAQNKAFVDFATDSMLLEVTDYYDRHGTPNQQVEAHYLLGCVYRDLGEATMAVGKYQDALDMAEALEGDCSPDIYLGILGQLASLFHSQYLPNDELAVRQQHLNFALQINDSMEYAYAKAQMMKPYYLMGENDSVLIIVDEAYKFYKEHGLPHIGSQFLPPAIYIYTTRQQYGKARLLINAYEGESGLFDSCGNIARGREHYYYTKGFYYQNIEMTDSAEFLYRKLLEQGNYDADAYKGLLAIYHKRQKPDSIAKFAFLYESALDSLHHNMEQQTIQKMSSLFNYNRLQRIALQKTQEAEQARKGRTVIISLLITVVAITVLVIRRNRLKQRRMHERLIGTLQKYNQLQKELDYLKGKNYESLISQKEKEIEELTNDYQQLLANNHLSDFEKSDIVLSFKEKATFKKGVANPVAEDWDKLIEEFNKNMPTVYSFMHNVCRLSTTELHVCVLLLLSFPESVIAALKDSKPQTINTAKVRANKKLFKNNSSSTLTGNLRQLIVS